MPEKIIEFDKVVAGYSPSLTILNETTLDVRKGEITLLIGPNGAGKSTVLKTLFGMLTPRAGEIRFEGRRVLYSWIGATRRDWRGQGHFRALTEESEAWAVAGGFHEVVVKTKNRYYDMRSTLTQLRFDVVKYERSAENAESKVYLSKMLSAEMVAGHRSLRSVVQVDS